MPSTKTLLAVVAAFLATTNAHMMMKTPVPYGKSTLNNSPLDGKGSDFPCKQRPGVYDAEGASNIMPIGVNQTLSFIGSAVHGGGSCQVSLTTDLQPTKSSKWMVIDSIIGGCPASAPGNLGEDPNGSGASTFQFSVPQGVSPGKYTLAWTWFNKVGNREMYMNCAPVTVTTGSSKRDVEEVGFSKRATLPDMFLANIGNGCATQDSIDLLFPDPGQVVQYAGTPGSKQAPPTGAGCAAQVAPTGGAGSTQSMPASTPTPTPSPMSSAAVEPSTTTTTVNVGGIFGQSPASTMTTMIATPITTPIGTITAVPPIGTAAPSPSGTGSSGSGTVTAGSTSCSTPGQEVCSSDGTMIGMCDQTGYVVLQPVAQGTKCQNGMMVFANQKRNFRYRNGHIRRNHAGF